jgi:hypothetical protein
LQLPGEVTIENVSEELDKVLDGKSREINNLITSSLTAEPVK